MTKTKLKLSVSRASSRTQSVLLPREETTGLNALAPTAIALGTILDQLVKNLEGEPVPYFTYEQAAEDIQTFLQSHRRYASASVLAGMTCSQAVRAWAYERMPDFAISYELSNRILGHRGEEQISRDASLRIVQLADDFLLVTKFCRNLHAVQIEMCPHAAGIGILFECHGLCPSTNLHTLENRGLDALIERYGRAGGFKLRPNLASDFIELHATVFNEQSQIGFGVG